MATMAAVLLALSLAIGAPGGVFSAFDSPDCEDNNPDTPCCPLESGHYVSDPDDWLACFEALHAPVLV